MDRVAQGGTRDLGKRVSGGRDLNERKATACLVKATLCLRCLHRLNRASNEGNLLPSRPAPLELGSEGKRMPCEGRLYAPPGRFFIFHRPKSKIIHKL
jgi:hypothetical protein